MDPKKLENLLRLAYMAVAGLTEWPEQSLQIMEKDCIRLSNGEKASAPKHWLSAFKEYLSLMNPETRDWMGYSDPKDIAEFNRICGS